MTDREFEKGLRDLLHGLRGKDREAAEDWARCLHKAGLPYWLRFEGAIGPREIVSLRERFAESDPDLLDMLEESYRTGCLAFASRCRGKAAYTPEPLPKGWPQTA